MSSKRVWPLLLILPPEESPTHPTSHLVGVEEWAEALEEEWEGAGEEDGGKSMAAAFFHASSIDEAWKKNKRRYVLGSQKSCAIAFSAQRPKAC